MQTSFHHPSSQPLQASTNDTNNKSIQIMLYSKLIVLATRRCISLQNPCCSVRTAPRVRDTTGFSYFTSISAFFEAEMVLIWKGKNCWHYIHNELPKSWVSSCASQTPMDCGLELRKEVRKESKPYHK